MKNLKVYYDAVQTAEARVDEIVTRIDQLTDAGNKEEADKLAPELDKAVEEAKKANQLYLSMRNASNGREEGDLGARLLTVEEDELKIGMSNQDIQNYSLLRAINAAAEAASNPRAWERAGLELEASQAMAKKLGREPQGFFVPWDIQAAPMRRVLNIRRPQNIQQAGAPQYGGYLIEEQLLSGSFIDVLRNRLILGLAGATTLTGLVGDIDIPKKTITSTAYWIGEGQSPDISTLEFGQVQARPRTVGAYIELTRRFLKQSSLDAEMMARDDMAATIAIAVDYAGLHGVGAGNQPRGLQHLSGIGAVVGGNDGAVPDWSDIVGLETEVATDNADFGRLAYVTNAKMRGALKQVPKASGEAVMIWEDGEVNGYPALVSNQVLGNLVKGQSGAVCSAIFFGNWADLVLCFWAGLDVIVDPYTRSTSGGVIVTALQDVDVIFRRAQSFAAMLDAKAS